MIKLCGLYAFMIFIFNFFNFIVSYQASKMQYINVGVERNLQRSIFIPHKRDMIGGK